MGRLILLISILFISNQAIANYDLEYNLATFHYFESCKLASGFSNQVADCGKTINNPIIGLKDRDSGIRGLLGVNSVGSFMAGATVTAQYPTFVIGMYLQDVSEFQRRNIIPFTILTNGHIGLTPIIGYEKSIKFYNYKIFSIITPILATIGIGYRF